MEATVVRKNFSSLGLQSVLANARSLVRERTSRALDRQAQKILGDLAGFLGEAGKAIDFAERRRGGSGSLVALQDSIRAERAYKAVANVLPADRARAKEEIQRLTIACERLVAGKSVSATEANRLSRFCRELVAQLDRERFESLSESKYILP